MSIGRIVSVPLLALGLVAGSGPCTKDATGNVVVVSIESVSPTTGPDTGGTVVTVNGTNFPPSSEVASVKFDAVPAANFSFESSTRATVTTPAHPAGTVDVTVVLATGDSLTLPGAFTFVAPVPPVGPPVIAGVSPNSGPTAGGTTIAVTGSNFLAGATVAVGQSPTTGVTVTPTTINATTSAGVAGTVNVLVRNPDGQSDTLTSAFTYVAPPPPDTGEPTFRFGVDSLITFDNFNNYSTLDQRHAARFTGPTSSGQTVGFVAINDPVDTTRYQLTSGRGGAGFAVRAVYKAASGQQRVSWATNRTQATLGPTATTVVQFYVRIQSGWSPGTGGLKWMEFWPASGAAGERLQVTPYLGTNANPNFGVGYAFRHTDNFGIQPASSAHWSSFNDGQWHRHTFEYRPAAVFGDQSGIVRYWIDGQKIIDISASTGIASGYCTSAEVGFIMDKQVAWLQFPDVGLSPGWNGAGTVDYDDFIWWVRK